MLARVAGERDKAFGVEEELRAKVEAAEAEREEDEDDDMLMGEGGDSRKTLLAKQVALAKELETTRTELAAYKENDPVEVEKRKELARSRKAEAEKWTEQILSMEGWFKKQVGGDKVQFAGMKQNWYGDEFDEEEGELREL